MPSLRYRQVGPLTFQMHFWDELVAGPENVDGRLPEDIGAHGLWYYFLLASINLQRAKENLVYEHERSIQFTQQNARQLLESISNMYGVSPAQMVRYWDVVVAQRAALGLSENADLPAEFRFRFN